MDAIELCGHFRPSEMKAAEDSRTPRRWRDRLHATPSGRFWSAGGSKFRFIRVLCRFFYPPLASLLYIPVGCSTWKFCLCRGLFNVKIS